MTHAEAVLHKQEAESKADESVKKMFHITIVPSNTEESNKYIEDFLQNPDEFNDESCIPYCSNDDFEVVSFGRNNVE